MNTGKKILVIEDNEVLGDVIVEKLSSAGYVARLAKDGEEGLSMIESEKPDLVLLDILLPKVNGYEILQKLNENGTIGNQPIIILSNSGQPVEISRVLALGVKDYLVKADFTPSEVLQKVEKHLGGSAGQSGGGTSAYSILEDGSLNILIVEDDELLRNVLAKKLGHVKCKVRYARDGEEALALIKEQKPSVILLDLILHGQIDGFEVLLQVRKDKSFSDVPIIVLSNLGQQEDITRAKALGADDFLIKANFSIEEIILRVQQILAEKQKSI